jgi:hypothetical protein
MVNRWLGGFYRAMNDADRIADEIERGISIPFSEWVNRVCVLRIRYALLLCDGNRTAAIDLLRIRRDKFYRLLEWDERRDAGVAIRNG